MKTKSKSFLAFGGVLGGLALAAAVLVGAAPGADNRVELMIGVWDDGGQLLSDATVATTVSDGSFVKAKLVDGYFQASDGGIVTPSGVKVAIDVTHPVWGHAICDVLFHHKLTLTLQVVFTGPGQIEVFSPDLVLPTTPGGGFQGGGPPNDLCAGAIDVAVPSITPGTTIGATLDLVGDCGTAVTTPGVWYDVVGDGNTLTASTCGNNGYDTKISVYCGDCNNLTCIAGNDDNCTSPDVLLSTVAWCSQAGVTYHVLVHGFGGEVGNFTLSLSSDGTPCTASVNCVPPPPVGACCFDDGSCQQLTIEGCAAAGGTFQGGGTSCFAPGTVTTYGDTFNVNIPDNNPGGISASVPVFDSYTVNDVNVFLVIDHTFVGDLRVTLTHGSTSVVIVDQPGVPALGVFGCGEDNYDGIMLDDEGTGGSIENACAPDLTSPPSYVPNNPLSAFDGADSSGDWILTVSDNAEFDLGALVAFNVVLEEAGEPLCIPAECFLVIGDDRGASPYVDIGHQFVTQVGPDVEDSYAVLLDDIPSFPLPALLRGDGLTAAPTFSPVGGDGTALIDAPESPAWMQDGTFAVQILMWNPNVFPNLPEQFSAGLKVTIAPDGKVSATPYGINVGGLQVWHDVYEDASGKRYIRFPFSIPGM